MAQPPNDLIAPPSDLVDPQAQSAGSSPIGEESSAPGRVGNVAGKIFDMTPPGQAWPTIKKGMESVDHTIYETGGVVADKASRVMPPEAAAALGFGTNLIGQYALGGGVGGGIGKQVGKGMESGARTLMQSSIKPTAADLVAGKADRAISTALDRGFVPNRENIAKLRGEIDTLMNTVEAAISRNVNKTVDQQKILDGIKPVFERFKNSIEESTRSTDIQKAINDFMGHPWIKSITRQPERTVESKILDASGKPMTTKIPASGTGQIPVKEAQDIKQGIYRDLGDKAYGPQAIPAAEQAARKGIAGQLRAGIEEAVPEVMPLNKQAGDLLNLGNVATRRAMMDANKNPLGLGLLAHNPAALAVFEAERSPIIKAHIANWLHRKAMSSQPFGKAVGALTAGPLTDPGGDDL